MVQQYSLDKKKAPLALQDLVDAGYLKSIPDDITGSNTSWQTQNEDPEQAWNPDEPGITCVYSGSDAESTTEASIRRGNRLAEIRNEAEAPTRANAASRSSK